MAGTWPCINGECADPSHSSCDRNNLYGCPPPSCKTNTDCNGLECRNGLCVDEFPQRKPTGSACDKHSDCLPSTLCANNKCETTQRVGSFVICDKDQDCLQGSTGTSKEVCAKYKTTDQKSGVCLLPTSDPNLIVTPIPFSTTRSYSITTRGIGYNRGRNCELHRELCGNNMYQQLMKDNCRETCRDAGYNLNCVNTHPNCVYWAANGYCDNLFYPEQTRRDTCGLICHLC
uniref:ShKT domain-containing protein n=1 Tax=Meloidogyne javanica TaxID=6303 RepID=A0A915LVP9_MELJA